MRTARGFTLIEFTVTFVVLALLTVLTMPSIGAWIANAIHVITIDARLEITDAVAFLDPSLFPRFGLPLTPT